MADAPRDKRHDSMFGAPDRLAATPLVVRREDKRFAKLRVLTYPLHDWGTFYGPIGPDPGRALAAAHDGARVAHAASRRSRSAGDEAHDRLGHVRLHPKRTPWRHSGSCPMELSDVPDSNKSRPGFGRR